MSRCSTTIEWEEIVDDCCHLNSFVAGRGDAEEEFREKNHIIQWEGRKHGRFRVRSRSRANRERDRSLDVVTKKVGPKLQDKKKICKRFSKGELNCDTHLKKCRRVSILKLNELDKKRDPSISRVKSVHKRRSGSLSSKISSRALKTVDFDKVWKKHGSKSEWKPAWQESLKFKREKYKIINNPVVGKVQTVTSQKEVKSYRKRANTSRIRSLSAEISNKPFSGEWEDSDDDPLDLPGSQDFEEALKYYMRASKWIEKNKESSFQTPKLKPRMDALPIVRWEHRQPGKGDHWRRGPRGEVPFLLEVKRVPTKKTPVNEIVKPAKNFPFAGLKITPPFLKRDPWLILPNLILLFLPTFLVGLILRFALEPLLLDDDYY